jgi:hypothetical protein
MTNRRIYLASSWRNEEQPDTVAALRAAGHAVYDFRHPKPGDDGFRWSEVDPDWQRWTPTAFRDGLQHPVAVAGFANDYDAMRWADTGVLLLPSGRSAHLEAGYFVGAGKELFVLTGPAPVEPELMYKMATGLCVTRQQLLDRLALPLSDGLARTRVLQQIDT